MVPIHYVIIGRLDTRAGHSNFLFPPPVHVACFLNISTIPTTSEDIGCIAVVYHLLVRVDSKVCFNKCHAQVSQCHANADGRRAHEATPAEREAPKPATTWTAPADPYILSEDGRTS